MQHDPKFIQLVLEAKQRIHEVSIDEVLQMLKQHKHFVLVDVREEHECAQGVLPKAIHICKGVLERDVTQKIPDLETEVVLYCGGGSRSALAADNLQKMGYRKVHSMSGGYRAWYQAGFPVEGEITA